MKNTIDGVLPGAPVLVCLYENPGTASLTYNTLHSFLVADDENEGAVIPIGPVGLIELGAKMVLLGLKLQEVQA